MLYGLPQRRASCIGISAVACLKWHNCDIQEVPCPVYPLKKFGSKVLDAHHVIDDAEIFYALGRNRSVPVTSRGPAQLRELQGLMQAATVWQHALPNLELSLANQS